MQWSDLKALNAAETERLTMLYGDAQSRIIAALASATARGNDTAHLQSVREQIAAILADLRDANAQWASEAVPNMYAAGAGLASGGFAGIHEQAAQILAENAYAQFDTIANVIGRQTDDYLRAIALDAITGPVFGAGTTNTAKSDIFTRLVQSGEGVIRTRADDSTYLGFQVSTDGKWWDMQTYAEMSARTTLADTMRAGSMLRMGEAGIDSFVVIGGADPCEDCQAVIDGGPYTAAEIDAMSADSGHFTGPNCCCDVSADTAALDQANIDLATEG